MLLRVGLVHVRVEAVDVEFGGLVGALRRRLVENMRIVRVDRRGVRPDVTVRRAEIDGPATPATRVAPEHPLQREALSQYLPPRARTRAMDLPGVAAGAGMHAMNQTVNERR